MYISKTFSQPNIKTKVTGFWLDPTWVIVHHFSVSVWDKWHSVLTIEIWYILGSRRFRFGVLLHAFVTCHDTIITRPVTISLPVIVTTWKCFALAPCWCFLFSLTNRSWNMSVNVNLHVELKRLYKLSHVSFQPQDRTSLCSSWHSSECRGLESRPRDRLRYITFSVNFFSFPPSQWWDIFK